MDRLQKTEAPGAGGGCPLRRAMEKHIPTPQEPSPALRTRSRRWACFERTARRAVPGDTTRRPEAGNSETELQPCYDRCRHLRDPYPFDRVRRAGGRAHLFGVTGTAGTRRFREPEPPRPDWTREADTPRAPE